MNDATPQPIRLADYTPPNWLIDEVHLTFRLHPERTRVTSKIAFRPNPDATDRAFRLDGEALRLVSAHVDGVPVEPDLDATGLTLAVPDGPFTWEAEVEINPAANTALEGLYMSKGLFSTQCEAQGFRKITYYPDRPDVMAPFTVRIESDLPVLLSNGNPVAMGEGFAEWHDPWPKPAYLFALVAGDLVAHTGQHRTADGRNVMLNIWVRPGDENRCAYALDALQRSMVWDEEVYGRNYDLDVFNVVAIDDFNAGAMENKGLNIFNSTYVLASPETATDDNYEWIESVVAHEYFHNWTGNRITCRDWFQLCLKEGLTVYRDQQFTGDMRSAPMKRIGDVLKLRARQFREDNGPLAHPVRPAEFVEINNFYTATVYEKGAEVIGMLKTLVGDEDYGKAVDLYFTRHDGEACTIEDWLKVFEDTTGRDLTQFALWYSQSGTPRVEIETRQSNEGWQVIARQFTPPTPGQSEKHPLVIPIRLALFAKDGTPLGDEDVHILDSAEAILTTASTEEEPIVSAFRDFSAPVILNQQLSTGDRLTLLAHDTDPFNRWEAGRTLAKDQLIAMITKAAVPDPVFLDALGRLITDESLDYAFRAFALGLPSESDLAQTLHDAGQTPDPDRIHAARKALSRSIGEAHGSTFEQLVETLFNPAAYDPNPTDAGRRALRLKAASYLSAAGRPQFAQTIFAEADNMTESMGALGIAISGGHGKDEAAIFFERWRNDPNTLDKWFSTLILNAAPERAVEVAREMTELPEFSWKTPNRFRAVVGGLTGNFAGFHQASGAGYTFVADWLAKLDPVNPQTAARMATVFETMQMFDGDRQSLMRDALERLRVNPSRDMGEITARILKA